ncbi:MAG: hypothetical protein JWL84_159 [Rhodospirillales bacterium]|jgi:hypothetical protein|nr:hypothetical protein [Rhodospirillales bacterium]
MYDRLLRWASAVAVVLSVSAVPAQAGQQTYNYVVEHPTYGKIGTYSDTVTQDNGQMRIDTRLRVAVRVLGIVMHREEADRTEIWSGNRLVSFHSVTTTNGKTLLVDGAARGNEFVITSPFGTNVAPADVYTSSPWTARLSRPSVTMMSTKTGKLEQAHLVAADQSIEAVSGTPTPVRHFQIATDKRQDVWLSPRDVPLRFRTEVGGTPIDFTLAPDTVAALVPAAR